MSTGDWLALATIIVTAILYGLGQLAVRTHDLRAARARLVGARAALSGWGESYFASGYEGKVAQLAKRDADRVKAFGWAYKYDFPTEPVAALISGTETSSWISEETFTVAGTALWRMTLLNGLIREQNALGREHLAAIVDTSTPITQRKVIATATSQISSILHESYGDGAWYRALIDTLGTDIARLDVLLSNSVTAVAQRLFLGEVPFINRLSK
jgi:hypothetical protein